jgi:predicted small secreted protein
MKKLILVTLLACLVFAGCMTVKVVAPPGQDITLLTEAEASSFKITKRAIFLIGGLIPIANNSTDDMLAKYDLENVRVTTEFDIIDWLISGITSGLVVTKSVTIEGNARK